MLSKLNQTGEAQTILKDIVAKMAKDANVKTSDKDLKDSLEFFTTTSEEQAKAAEEAAKKAEENAAKEESNDKAEDTDKESK